MSIQFTQFLRPHGRRVAVKIDRPPEIEALATELTKLGVRFEIEELTTGEASMEAMMPSSDDEDPEVLSSRICPNGPEVPAKVDEMIREAWHQISEGEPKRKETSV